MNNPAVAQVTLWAGYIWPILGLISGTHTPILGPNGSLLIPHLQVFMWRQLVWKVNHLWGIQQQLATSNSWLLVSSSCIGTRIRSGTDLVSSPLRHHDDAPDLLHLRVVGRADSIQVACNLRGEGKQRQLGTWYILTCYSLHVWEEVNGSWPPAS